jgi:hypothetical protein
MSRTAHARVCSFLSVLPAALLAAICCGCQQEHHAGDIDTLPALTTLTIEPAAAMFPDTFVGVATAPRAFRLLNAGDGSIAGLTLMLAGPGSNEFSLVSDACSGRPLPAGAGCDASVQLLSISAGGKNATLQAISTTPSLMAEAAMSGNVQQPASLALFLQTTSFTSSSPSMCLQVINSGPGPAGPLSFLVSEPVEAFNVGPPRSCTGAQNDCLNRTAPLAVDESCYVEVTFNPPAAGTYEAVAIVHAPTGDASIALHGMSP